MSETISDSRESGQWLAELRRQTKRKGEAD
jgi:hypothetical protein